MGFIGKRNGKCLAGLNVQPGFLAFTDKQDDFIVVTNLTPGNVHDIDFLIFIICGNHQNRHGIDSLHQTQILFHYYGFLSISYCLVGRSMLSLSGKRSKYQHFCKVLTWR